MLFRHFSIQRVNCVNSAVYPSIFDWHLSYEQECKVLCVSDVTRWQLCSVLIRQIQHYIHNGIKPLTRLPAANNDLNELTSVPMCTIQFQWQTTQYSCVRDGGRPRYRTVAMSVDVKWMCLLMCALAGCFWHVLYRNRTYSLLFEFFDLWQTLLNIK